MERLCKACNANAFIREPQPTKEMYDAVQNMHPKTLSACFIIMASTSTSKRNVDIIYRDMMEQVMESGRPRAPLHLKVLAYHHDLVAQGEALPLELHAQAVASQETGSRRHAHRSRTEDDTGTAHARVRGRRVEEQGTPRIDSQEGIEDLPEVSLHDSAA